MMAAGEAGPDIQAERYCMAVGYADSMKLRGFAASRELLYGDAPAQPLLSKSLHVRVEGRARSEYV